jgi:hypothetical protein
MAIPASTLNLRPGDVIYDAADNNIPYLVLGVGPFVGDAIIMLLQTDGSLYPVAVGYTELNAIWRGAPRWNLKENA